MLPSDSDGHDPDQERSASVDLDRRCELWIQRVSVGQSNEILTVDRAVAESVLVTESPKKLKELMEHML